MKKTVVTTAFAIALLSFSPARALAEVPIPMVGIIDLQQLEKDSKALQSLQKQKDDAVAALKDKVMEKGKELTEEKDKLEKKKSNMSEEAFMERALELQNKFTTYQQELQDEEKMLSESLNEATKKFNDEGLRPALNKLAEDMGINLILPKNLVLYNVIGMDLTADVVKILNKDYPKMKLEIKAAPKAKDAKPAKPTAPDKKKK